MKVFELLGLTKEVTGGMRAHPTLFTNPDPPLADLDTAAAELEKSQAGMKTKQTTRKDRDEKQAALEALLSHEADYVISVSELLPPDKAAAAIAASGFTQLEPPPHTKAVISAKAGPVSGSVEANALRSAVAEKMSVRVVFFWQYSLNGKDWIDCGHSVETRMIITGLPVGATISVRYRAYVKKAYTDPSQAVSLVVT
jgi:hypothetical protein